MSLIQEIQRGEYYEVDVLGMYKCVVPADDGGTVFGIVSGLLDAFGLDDRTMQMGENPLYEKTLDGKHILATLTRCKPNGQPFTTEEIRQRGALATPQPDAGEREDGDGE